MEVNYVGIVLSFVLMMALICGLYLGLKKVLSASKKGTSIDQEDLHVNQEQKRDDGERPKGE